MSPRTPSSFNFAGTPSASAPLGTSIPPGTNAPAPTKRPRAHDRAMQHDRTGADERAVFDRAPFEVREVADRAVVADDGFEHTRAVQHRAVLHRRARPDHDAALVAAQHGLGPDRGTGADHDVADDRRLLVHERLGIDLRFDVAERIQGHGNRD